ncbi:hypothetical protein PHAVU_003G202600 [Phaseolus vulgaris]|uniref:Uncharacterized protein n=1 Tax=Phaseolus vulgaris TaxID=3885 RepID=V7CB79_PHAVU|nr:hypothetical protein PHAVU_003G202600g [Phaseolus vulgaris]ESW27447.1 hypothetical protein PHAVU_003G202600g [Phaseolus vulgaris]
MYPRLRFIHNELYSWNWKYSNDKATLITRDPVAEKRAKVETLREKVEEQKTKHEKSVYNKAKFSEEENVLRENYRAKIDLLQYR